MKKIITLILSVFIAVSAQSQITPTNYALQTNWAAGKMKGALDMHFNPSFSIISPDTLTQTVVNVNYDSTTNYDIFIVYPTILVDLSGTAKIQQINVVSKAAANTALVPFSQYAQFGRIYAPYYRQGNLATFYASTSKGLQAAIFDTVVTDIIASFTYYMQHYNNGKKVIIIGHSQGAMALAMMLRKFETTPAYTSYLNKIFLSVLVGMESGPYVLQSGLTGGWWQTIPICQNPTDTACVMSWGTHRYGATLVTFPNLVPYNDSLVAHGYMYQTFNPSVHRAFMDPIGFSSVQKQVKYSVYPKALFKSATHTDYAVTTTNVAYTNMYYGSISNPNVTNYGLMIDSIPAMPADYRLDPLDSAGSDYHIYDNCVAIGDVICLMYTKTGRSCPYDYLTGIDEQSESSSDIISFPNPAENYISLQFSKEIKIGVASVYNSYGQLLRKINFSGNQLITYRGNLSDGIYLIRITENNKLIGTKKIIFRN